MASQDYLHQRRIVFEEFRNSYITEYKALGKKIAECKVKCFTDETLNRIQTDECARRCAKPQRKQQELNSARVYKCEEKFQTGMQLCRTGKVRMSEQECSNGMLRDYKECFETEAPIVKANVKKYADMFDDIVYTAFEEEQKELTDYNKKGKKASDF